MGSGIAKQAPAEVPKPPKTHPEDAEKPGLLFPGKESFVSDEFTRWSVNKAMEIVFEKFQEMVDTTKVTERTILAVINDDQVDANAKWNDCSISPNVEYVKAFIIDFDPTIKSGENLHVYSYLVQAKFLDKIDQYLQAKIEEIT
jgi:hypothetical protein